MTSRLAAKPSGRAGAHLLDVKQRVLQSNAAQLKPLAQRMLRENDPDRLQTLLQRLNV